jgi:hypothetical protein
MKFPAQHHQPRAHQLKQQRGDQALRSPTRRVSSGNSATPVKAARGHRRQRKGSIARRVVQRNRV